MVIRIVRTVPTNPFKSVELPRNADRTNSLAIMVHVFQVIYNVPANRNVPTDPMKTDALTMNHVRSELVETARKHKGTTKEI